MNKLIPETPATLWHYTCVDHGHPGILDSGFVRPSMTGLSWFTDLDRPDAAALGLVKVSLNCNRWAVRYRIDDTTEIVPYLGLRVELAADAQLRDYFAALEAFPGALPRHWFVSGVHVAAAYDPL